MGDKFAKPGASLDPRDAAVIGDVVSKPAHGGACARVPLASTEFDGKPFGDESISATTNWGGARYERSALNECSTKSIRVKRYKAVIVADRDEGFSSRNIKIQTAKLPPDGVERTSHNRRKI